MTRDKDNNEGQDSDHGPASTPQEHWEASELALKDGYGLASPAERARLVELMGFGSRISGKDPVVIFMEPQGTDLKLNYQHYDKSKSEETVHDFFSPQAPKPRPISKFKAAINWARSKIGRPAR